MKELQIADHNVALPPAWAFGVLYGSYLNQDDSLAKVDRLLEEDFPIDALWIDSCIWDFTKKGPKGYLSFEEDKSAFPDFPAFLAALESRTVRAGIWVWDRILETGNEETFREFDQRGFFRKKEVMHEKWHTDGKSVAGYPDFANPRVARFWKEKLRPFLEAGVDFLKLDAGPEVPYLRAGFEATQEYGVHTGGRGMILHHATAPGNPLVKQYPIAWTGDAEVKWSAPGPHLLKPSTGGLAENVFALAVASHPLNAVPFLANDTGGFTFGTPDDELYRRWSQFSAFAPIMEVFGANGLGNDSNAPYTYSTETRESFRHHARLRLQLFPYIYTYAHRHRIDGVPMTRGTGMHGDQFTLGEELLVAPVLEPGATQRSVFLPKGRWYAFEGDAAYPEKWCAYPVTVPTPPDRIPLFVRAGAILPMREYHRSILLGSNDPLVVHVHPWGRSEFTLIEDDGTSNDYLNGDIARTVLRSTVKPESLTFEIEPVEGSFSAMAPERRVRLLFFRIASFEGATATPETPLWTNFEGQSGVLTLEFPMNKQKGAALEIRARLRTEEG